MSKSRASKTKAAGAMIGCNRYPEANPKPKTLMGDTNRLMRRMCGERGHK